ncbi:hypothetical protein EV360DRAFT_68505 [Lentinula raphanica]|nr:hypothetical protein EV360DRAFT_74835 [Lentinula raphanica]KAJ3760694.1 hypothetical protein EV360DRAFT_68505 [Lentinula raphanica]
MFKLHIHNYILPPAQSTPNANSAHSSSRPAFIVVQSGNGHELAKLRRPPQDGSERSIRMLRQTIKRRGEEYSVMSNHYYFSAAMTSVEPPYEVRFRVSTWPSIFHQAYSMWAQSLLGESVVQVDLQLDTVLNLNEPKLNPNIPSNTVTFTDTRHAKQNTRVWVPSRRYPMTPKHRQIIPNRAEMRMSGGMGETHSLESDKRPFGVVWQ